MDRPFGGIAQLGEHLPCKQGVSGSIPLTSTTQTLSVFCESLIGIERDGLESKPNETKTANIYIIYNVCILGNIAQLVRALA